MVFFFSKCDFLKGLICLFNCLLCVLLGLIGWTGIQNIFSCFSIANLLLFTKEVFTNKFSTEIAKPTVFAVTFLKSLYEIIGCFITCEVLPQLHVLVTYQGMCCCRTIAVHETLLNSWSGLFNTITLPAVWWHRAVIIEGVQLQSFIMQPTSLTAGQTDSEGLSLARSITGGS